MRLTKGFSIIEVIIVVVVLAVVAVGGYLLWSKDQTHTLTTDTQMSNSDMAKMSPTPTPTVDQTAGWKTYTSTTYGYSIKYPSSQSYLDLSKQGSNGAFVVFNDAHVIANMHNTEPFGAILSVTDGVNQPVLNRDRDGKLLPESDIRKIMVDGENGEQWTTSDASYVEIAVGYKGKTYTFEDSGAPRPSIEDFNLMVQSFKFTDK